MHKRHLALAALAFLASTSVGLAGTLDDVRARDKLVCGVSEGLGGFSAQDGAGAWQRFWSITFPLLLPIVVVILVLRTSFAFAVFEEILAITQGGPGDATWVAAWYSYKKSFAPPFDIGIGSASAYVLAIIVGLLALAVVATNRPALR